MTLSVVTDSLRNVSCRTEGNVIMELRTTAIVHSDGSDITTDATGLQNVLDATGLPQDGSTLKATTHPNLFVASRVAAMESPRRAQVTIDYQFFNRRLNYQRLLGTTNEGYYYWPIFGMSNVNTSILGPIPGSPEPPGAGELPRHDPIVVQKPNFKDQTANVVAAQAEPGFRTQVVVCTENPLLVVSRYGNSLNLEDWNGQSTTKWWCRSVTFRPLDLRFDVGETRVPDKQRFVFDFEFMFNPKGWQPKAQYVDPQTGRGDPSQPPRDIEWHRLQNFNIEPGEGLPVS
jgi:hypothetical protein